MVITFAASFSLLHAFDFEPSGNLSFSLMKPTRKWLKLQFVRGGKSTKIFYSSKSTITLLKFYLSTSKSTSLKIYSSKSKK